MAHTGHWHINKHGVPAPCHAKPGNCPLGGADQHFKTAEEAQKHVDKLNMESYGLLAKTVGDLSERLEKVEQVVLPEIEDIIEQIETQEQSEVDEFYNPSKITQENGEIKEPIIMKKEVQRELFNGLLEEVYGNSVDRSVITREYLDEAEDYANHETLKALDRSLSRLGDYGIVNKEYFNSTLVDAQIEGTIKAYERYFKENDLDFKWKRNPTPAEKRAIEQLEQQCDSFGKKEKDALVYEYNKAKKEGGLLNIIKMKRLQSEITNKYSDLIKLENKLEHLKAESTTAKFPEFFSSKIKNEYKKNPEKLNLIRKHLTKRITYLAMKELES